MDWLTQQVQIPVWLWIVFTIWLAAGAPKITWDHWCRFGSGWASIWRRHIRPRLTLRRG